MSSLGKRLRLRRILKNGRSLVLPMDHAIYSGPVAGLEDPGQVVRTAAESGADAVLCTAGMLETISADLGNLAVILRIDGTHTRLGQHLETTHLIASVEHACRLGVEAVAINVFIGTDNEDVLLSKLGKVAEDCRREGMVLVGEMIPARLLRRHYGTEVADPSAEEKADLIATAARVGAEIGVDLLKINYSGTADTYRTVVDSCLRPVLVAGGMKAGNDTEFLSTVADALEAGAAGICAGRNVWQRPDMKSTLSALYSLVHGNRPLEEVLSGLSG